MKKQLLLAVLAVPLVAAAPAPAPSPEQLRATIRKLVSFGTRHTLSADRPDRGIEAARKWVEARLGGYAKDCGGCLKVERVADRFEGERAPDGVVVQDVFAVQPGTTDPDRVVIVQAHLDSRASDIMDSAGDAPGANDDGSGSALVLEAARLLSKQKFAATVVYALLSGEEQGLWGGKLLAATAKSRGWKVAAVLNNDIVGNTHGQGGEHVDNLVRVFSEGIRSSEGPDAAQARRANGGEDDGPSRALAKYLDRVDSDANKDLEVVAIRRPDRFRRGGDHIPFLALGYPGVRITEYAENYAHQHQTPRTENGIKYGDSIEGVDFAYLAKVTALNVSAIRQLASAPAAPTDVGIEGAVSPDTTVSWAEVPGAAAYRVRWRRADSADWQASRDVKGRTVLLKNINIDDNFFGVSALSESGAESLTTFAGAAQ